MNTHQEENHSYSSQLRASTKKLKLRQRRWQRRRIEEENKSVDVREEESWEQQQRRRQQQQKAPKKNDLQQTLLLGGDVHVATEQLRQTHSSRLQKETTTTTTTKSAKQHDQSDENTADIVRSDEQELRSDPPSPSRTKRNVGIPTLSDKLNECTNLAQRENGKQDRAQTDRRHHSPRRDQRASTSAAGSPAPLTDRPSSRVKKQETGMEPAVFATVLEASHETRKRRKARGKAQRPRAASAMPAVSYAAEQSDKLSAPSSSTSSGEAAQPTTETAGSASEDADASRPPTEKGATHKEDKASKSSSLSPDAATPSSSGRPRRSRTSHRQSLLPDGAGAESSRRRRKGGDATILSPSPSSKVPRSGGSTSTSAASETTPSRKTPSSSGRTRSSALSGMEKLSLHDVKQTRSASQSARTAPPSVEHRRPMSTRFARPPVPSRPLPSTPPSRTARSSTLSPSPSAKRDYRRSVDLSHLSSVSPNAFTVKSANRMRSSPQYGSVGRRRMPSLSSSFGPASSPGHASSPSPSSSPIVDMAQTFETRERSDKMVEKRQKIVRELLETERSYMENLRTLVDVYLSPLREFAFIDDLLTSLFSDVEVIVGYNGLFLASLEQVVLEKPDQQCIGPIFLKLASFLKSYKQYITHYTKATTRLRSLQQDPEFVKLLERLRTDAGQNKGIKDFLIMPVQRIPRYLMLLMDLERNTWSSHADSGALKDSIATISDIAEYVEESQVEAERISKVMSIREVLVGKLLDGYELVAPSRKYVKETPVSIVSYPVGNKIKSEKAGQLFLFNDLIILTRNKSKDKHKRKFEVIRFIPMDSMKTVDLEDDQCRLRLGAKDFETSIRFTDPGTKDTWCTAIRGFMQEAYLRNQDKIFLMMEKMKNQASAKA
mmetsp:Transcript_1181/g.3590  ORF Transcript_1181/g.3590 Transcript_1181/m.3590 type:complete len:890 (-) Transcript_1181:1727-4396(-)